MQKAFLEKLKQKPQPKTKEEYAVVFKPSSKEDVAIKMTIVDERSKHDIDMANLLSKMKTRVNVSVPTQSKPAASTKQMPTKQMPTKSIKGKKIKLVDAFTKQVPGPTAIGDTVAKKSRITKAPDQSIIFEADSDVVIKPEFIERLPVEKEKVLVKSSTYYMNNREIFVNFINSLFEPYKDELKKAESERDSSSSTERDLFTHQKIVRDYLNLYTPYRGLLLYHGLGSGKTCSSIAIAEGMKSGKNVLIMTPAALRMNYIEQLKECGDPIFKKNQFWEFVEASDDNTIKQLSKILSLPYDYVQKNSGAWLVDLKKPSNYDSLTIDDRTSLDNQILKMIRFKYEFINYNGLRNESLDKLTNHDTINPFDNKVIVIDEAHNFVSRIVNKLKRPESLSMRMYHYLMNAKNARIVLLSGTPIINYPNEIAICFNILRGYIKTWSIPLNVKTETRMNDDTLRSIILSSPKTKQIVDVVDYKPSSKILKVTFNPFGFVNKYHGEKYKGVSPDSRGQLDDSKQLILLRKVLADENIDMVQEGIKVDNYKALPDDPEQFNTYFIDSDTGNIKNENLLKRRILGLTSYYGDIEHLMPKYNKDEDFKVIELPMSDYMFGVYEAARIQERKVESSNKKKKKQQKDIYEETVGTYRIFSRAFCNFVFPRAIGRPLPKDGQDIETTVEEADEDVMDGTSIDERLANVDGQHTVDDLEQIRANIAKQTDETYETRIQDALKKLGENASTFLTKEALQLYSPKFLHILENLQDPELSGSHLIYTQFRTLEGIGILSMVLNHHGFARFKIKKDTNGVWKLDIPDEDKGKPMYALYTGTEDQEENEIIRKIYNSEWSNIPVSLKTELLRISSNNFMGEIIKTIMITASGAEGINLKNCRFVHIVEPYWHPVRIDQVIGRARRILSHKDLPEELRTIKVFLYLMTFTKKQLDSDAAIELRLKDKSKLDKLTPLSTDQSLFEISNIKETINKRILYNIKQAAIDCALHYRADSKDPVVCYSFGNVSNSNMAYHPSISDEEGDSVGNANQEKVNFKAEEMNYYGKKYAKRVDSNEVYDYDTFVAAMSNPQIKPRLIGHWIKTDGKRGKLVKVVF
jgi:hypothetical protein